MKNKLLVCVSMICLSVMVLMIGVRAEKHETVYGTISMQERAYSVFMNESSSNKSFDIYGFEIVKESITPTYTVDMIEYAKTNVFKIESLTEIYERAENKKGKTEEGYIAKVIRKSDGAYAGTVNFYITEGSYHGRIFQPVPEFVKNNRNESWPASCSYADHANRIRIILGLSEIVPPENVKYVCIPYVGDFFYVTVGEDSHLIPVGTIYKEGKAPHGVGKDRVVSLEEIKEQADIQLKWQEDYYKAKAEWEATHPGEEYIIDGGVPPVQSITVSIGEIDNINNIREYLGMEMGEPISTSSDENNASSYSYLIIPAAVVAVALVIAVAVVVLKKKKQAKASDISEQELLP